MNTDELLRVLLGMGPAYMGKKKPEDCLRIERTFNLTEQA